MVTGNLEYLVRFLKGDCGAYLQSASQVIMSFASGPENILCRKPFLNPKTAIPRIWEFCRML